MQTATAVTKVASSGGGQPLMLNASCFMPLDLSTGVAAVTTLSEGNTGATLKGIQAAVKTARAKAGVSVAPTIPNHAELKEAADAMMSGLMWNALYHPTQLGPFVSVSRRCRRCPLLLPRMWLLMLLLMLLPMLLPLLLLLVLTSVISVWSSFTAQPYELFEWDSYFGATMLSFDERALPLALSTLIQVTKSKVPIDLDGLRTRNSRTYVRSPALHALSDSCP